MTTAPCKDCKERTVEPNCHTTCDKYKQFCERQEKVKEAERIYKQDKYVESRLRRR